MTIFLVLVLGLGFCLSQAVATDRFLPESLPKAGDGALQKPWVDIEQRVVKPEVKLPILIYHCIGQNPQSPNGNDMFVTTKKFEEQIKYFSDHGYTPVFVKNLGNPLPPKPVAITFDDGYKNNYTEALPILEKYQFKATIFLVGQAVDEGVANRLSWDEMRLMRDTGLIDIQSHTYNMHDSFKTEAYVGKPKENETEEAYTQRVLDDILKQQEVFIRELGYSPRVIAFPNGYYNDLLNAIYLNNGYTISCTTRVDNAQPDRGLSLLPRVPIFSFSKFTKLMHQYG